MKIVAIVQARRGSVRLPDKVMKLITGIPMIEILLKRLGRSKLVDQIILASSTDIKNKILVNQVEKMGFSGMQGSELDVLDRYVKAAEQCKADIIVRITGDCPLIDPVLVDECINKFIDSKVDYCSNTIDPTFPDGLDVEVFKFSALKRAAQESTKLYHREHVTPYIKENDIFSKLNFSNNEDFSDLRWCVDDPEDFEVVSKIFEYFKPKIHFSWSQVIELYNSQPELFAVNSEIPRNQGGTLNTGQKLWKRAKRVIPGGNMLLSKRPERFLPNYWPTYFSKAKDCFVWDMDNNKFIDMSIMGIGTNILGYGNKEVDNAAKKALQSGNLSTLNCAEEVYLAEKLVELHPWSDMVRFCRTGGEANAVAIRIARAASGKDKVAVCGYHGWHDWYLSSNLGRSKSLDGHLLPGLEPNGVPRNLKDTVFTFSYNNFDELEKIVQRHDIGIIKMEVMRDKEPKDDFLFKIRQLATKKKIVLIFDECTSGFRETFGGLHKKYKVEPDMAMFGKALGNGYAITAILGKREIMDAAQKTFISSTFWTERIGPSAALKTLEVMEREKSWKIITKIGLNIRSRWQKIADNNKIKILNWGLPALTGFTILNKNELACRTFITQEMLNKGYLAGNCIYVSTKHTPEIIDGYFDVLNEVFKTLSNCQNDEEILNLIKGGVCETNFKRLT